MKAKQVTRLVALLAFAALALAACNKAATNTNNSNNSSNSTSNSTSNNTSNSTSNSTSNTAGDEYTGTTGTTGAYSTPTAAFKTFYEAAKANNVEGIKRSVSKKTLEAMRKEAAKENKSIDEMLKDTAKGTPPGFPETRNEKIDGDKAKLEFKDVKRDKWETASFVKENGEWKLALADEAAEAMEKMDHMGEEEK